MSRLVIRANDSLAEVVPAYPCNGAPHPELNPLSLHDALPIFPHFDPRRIAVWSTGPGAAELSPDLEVVKLPFPRLDLKSTRLNSSHSQISYAVFCLKKKRQVRLPRTPRPGLSSWLPAASLTAS